MLVVLVVIAALPVVEAGAVVAVAKNIIEFEDSRKGAMQISPFFYAL
jgi:hypothetical protein